MSILTVMLSEGTTVLLDTNQSAQRVWCPFGKPMYVADKDIEKNTVTLCTNDELVFSREVNAVDLICSFLSYPMNLSVKPVCVII